jgi:hypothetical protein
MAEVWQQTQECIHEALGSAGGDLAGVPVASVLGDQQASLFGHTCFDHGDMKNTYGTGAFLLFTLGNEPLMSKHGLVTTVAWKLGEADPVYALEGSVAMAGALVQWLRDNLGIIDDAREVEALARSVEGSAGVVFVPAFSGLLAPYWRDDARGVIVGLTRFATKGHIARAALEATAYQTYDLAQAMLADTGLAQLGESRGRGHDQERPADAVPSRHSRLFRGGPRRHRDDRHRRRLCRGACNRILVRARRAACQLHDHTPLAASDGRGRTRTWCRRLAKGCRSDARPGGEGAGRCWSAHG